MQKSQLFLFNRIDKKLSQLNKTRPIPKSSLVKIREKFSVEMTYNSNAIEGNSLTLKETYWVINEGLTIKGKPLKDHLEAKDHHQALEYLYDLVNHQAKPTLSENTIKSIHAIVMKKTDEEFAGRYRTSNVWIGGSDHTPPESSAVPGLMRDMIRTWFYSSKDKHPIILAAHLHHKLVHVHPFFDGNGRTARLIMNIILMQAGYPLVVILKNDRKKYYRALSFADKRDYHPLVMFIARSVERSLDIYLKTVGSEESFEIFLPIAQIAPNFSYSLEYLSLLARQGKLEAHKEKRSWLTSVQAVERYIANRERKRKIS